MGTSIAEAGKAADNLLDFQSSISKELEKIKSYFRC